MSTIQFIRFTHPQVPLELHGIILLFPLFHPSLLFLLLFFMSLLLLSSVLSFYFLHITLLLRLLFLLFLLLLQVVRVLWQERFDERDGSLMKAILSAQSTFSASSGGEIGGLE